MMPDNIGRNEPLPDPTVAPLRVCAAALAATQDGARGMGQAAWEMAWSWFALFTQQAQLAVGWAEVAGVTLAQLADSRELNDLVEANVAIARTQGRQALEAASVAIAPLCGGRPAVEPLPIVGSPKSCRPDAERLEREDGQKVSECMTRDVQRAAPNDTLAEAARRMAQMDFGVLPVAAKDRLVGVITDRDIAVRAMAEGKGPDAKVSEVMSREVQYCFDDEEVAAVLRNMGHLQVGRLPVLDHAQRLVGIVSLGDLAGRRHAVGGPG